MAITKHVIRTISMVNLSTNDCRRLHLLSHKSLKTTLLAVAYPSHILRACAIIMYVAMTNI